MIRRRTEAKWGLRVWIYVVILLSIVALVVWKGLPTKPEQKSVEKNQAETENDVVILVE